VTVTIFLVLVLVLYYTIGYADISSIELTAPLRNFNSYFAEFCPSTNDPLLQVRARNEFVVVLTLS
jgi:hypothetical protein